MRLTIAKTLIHRDGINGMSVDLHGDGTKLCGVDLRLPADDKAVNAIIDSLASQAEHHGIRINGRQRLAIFQSIEMGAVR